MIYFLLIFTLFCSALFSGIEIAFVSSNKFKVELNKQSGTRSEKILARFYENESNFITALLIGNNIMLILFSGYMARVLADDFGLLGNGGVSLLLQTIITTITVLIFGEFIPKALFRLSPYRTLSLIAIPLQFAYSILKYPAYLFSTTAKMVIKWIMPQQYDNEKAVFTAIDLENYIKHVSVGHPGDDDDELNADIFEKALYLKEVKIRECMVPRMEIQALDVSSNLEDLVEKFVESKLSRILIYEENIDNILGYVHHFDLINEPKSVRDNIYDILVVPEAMSARDLLTKFTKEHKNIACVVDEFGGTAGIVTLEDLIEEIFGEIQDEHDEDEFIEKQLTEDKYVFSARLEIDYLNEKYDLNIPEGEYETLAGYVVETYESIPQEGEKITINNFHIHIVSAENVRIKTIEIERFEVED
ncbi:MAG: hemolysin family protein [Chitinophagales bacterium]